MSRLQASNDTAFELLGRCLNEKEYEPWDEKAGKTARIDWRTNEQDPLKWLREYRNALLHGRVRVQGEGQVNLNENGERYARVFFYQPFEKMGDALDWREAKAEDLISAAQLIDEAWTKVLGYFREAWSGRLLPSVCGLRLPIPQLPDPQLPRTVFFQTLGAQSVSAAPPPSPGEPSPGSAVARPPDS